MTPLSNTARGLCLLFSLIAAPAWSVGIVCHRGANLVAPENTMASAKACFLAGGSYVEVDVRTSADGVLYILHDSIVDRTTESSGKIAELNSQAIDQLDAGSWFSPQFANERIPRLRDLLIWSKGKIGVYLDVKKARPEALAAMVRELGVENQVFFGFKDTTKALAFRRVAPDLQIKASLIVASDLEFARSIHATLVEAVIDNFDPLLVRAAAGEGFRTMVYTTKDDAETYKRILANGFGLANINNPHLMRSLSANP